MMRQLLYSILIIIAILFYFLGDFNPMDKEGLIYACTLSIMGLLVHILTPEKERILNRNFFKPSVFALLGLVIVNLQFYLDYILGIADIGNDFIWINNNIVVKSAFLSSIGINSFLLGFSLYKHKKNKTFVHKKLSIVKVEHILFLATIVLGIYYYTIDKRYLFGGYGIIDIGSTATYMALLFQLLIYTYIIQKVRNLYALGGVRDTYDYFRKMGYGVAILIFLYLVSVLLSGDRGPIIQFSLVYATGFFFLTKQKLHLRKALIFLFLAGFVLNLLRNVRDLGSDIPFTDKLEIALLGNSEDKGETHSISPPTTELASSLRTLHYAMDYTNRGGDYMYGRFLFQQFSSSIPFFSNFSSLIFDDLSYKYGSSATFFTWIEQGDFPSSGVGSSVVADFYIDLGILGVVFGLIVFGLLMNFMDHKLYEEGIPSLWTMTFLFSYITIALYIARSDLFSNLKMVVWIYILLITNYFLTKRS